ncbi:MAG: hypothetical protein K0U38_08895 [Epsilonproteobacteria bacterium]|nr:hypothetical protein [Campylobacterota bacterium]
MEELDIIKRVFLLAVAKREEGESMKDVLETLVNTGMFDLKEGKQVLKELRDSKHIVGENLSMTGAIEADKAEKEFKQ